MEFPRDQDERQRIMYEAQLRNNELLEKIIQLLTKPTVDKPPVNRSANKQTNKPVNKSQPRGKQNDNK